VSASCFTAQTGIAVQLVPSLGTSGANRALANGVIDAAISGRPLTAAEIASGLTTVAEFRTPFGLVTSHPDPSGLKSGDIARIFRSANPTWADGTPMRIILRPTTDSDSWLLGHLFPGMTEAMTAIRKRSDLSVAATDQDNADMAEQIPGSLTGATFTQVKMEKRKLRFVAIDGAIPSLDGYKSGAYPIGKALYLVLGAKKCAACERFVAFLRSADGIAALHETGILLSRE
jgi:phosphate transport system substrate-binding protein